MVSSTHWLASQTGMAILERGGNAFDAAVAAGFVLQVVEPHLNGPGGDLPIILWDARRAKVEVICGQGPAPRAASIRQFQELGLEDVPGTGLLAACVPGAFGAWLMLLGEHGTMRPIFRSEWPESARLYLTNGVPEPGSSFRNLDLGQTYQRILEEAESAGAEQDRQIEAARRAFYQGFVAEAIDAACRVPAMDSSGQRHAGLLTAADLAAWRARKEPSTQLTYRDASVHKTAPWGQGPVFLQQLALLDGVDVKAMGFLSADHIHTVVESAKLAFADREAWHGDPDFADVPMAALLEKGYALQRRRLITDRASLELRPGSVGGRRPVLPGFAHRATRDRDRSQSPGDPTLLANPFGDTCHVAVIDRAGNLVAATPSGGWLQSSPVIPGLGFPLGTRAQMFNLDEGHPNALQGGKRPRTTLSPNLVLRGGEPWLAFGTPGGDQQDQWSLNFFLAHAVFGLNLQEAIDAPMFHSSHFPSSFYPHESYPGRVHAENRLELETVLRLRDRGHDLVLDAAWSLGRMCVAGKDPKTGQLMAAANPRGMQGYAVGR